MLEKIKAFFIHKKEARQVEKAVYGTLLGTGILGLLAAFTLSLEKIHLLQDPDAILSCTFNLVLNCSVVMQSWQSTVFFGIPNMYIGLMAFPVIITVAVAGLWGMKFPKSFLIATNIGVLLGTIFAYWLFFSSVYDIQVLCPWCLLVTFACTLMLAAITHLNLYQNSFRLPKKIDKKVQAFLRAGYHQLVVASWLVLMFVLVYLKFGTDLFA